MQFERWTPLNLDRGRAAQIDLGTLYEGDSNSLLLGVELFDSDGPVSVTGTVSGWALLADGTTLEPFEDVGKSSNRAWIVLPQDAMYPGRLQVYLRITDNDEYAVSLDAVGAVKRTDTGTVVVPGTPLPNVSELRQIAADCVEATAEAQAIVEDWSIATVSETTTYLGI